MSSSVIDGSMSLEVAAGGSGAGGGAGVGADSYFLVSAGVTVVLGRPKSVCFDTG
jgi:hypothetical protein